LRRSAPSQVLVGEYVVVREEAQRNEQSRR
jgi:hypothetical protein